MACVAGHPTLALTMASHRLDSNLCHNPALTLTCEPSAILNLDQTSMWLILCCYPTLKPYPKINIQAETNSHPKTPFTAWPS